MVWHTQNEFALRLEWGVSAIEHLADRVECVIVVDVMSFSTCVSLAIDHDAQIYPYRWKDDSAETYAKSLGIECASLDRKLATPGYSLSPQSIKGIQPGSKLLLPSPNGSTVSLLASGLGVAVYSGCFRNMAATANACKDYASILLVPCGERWPDGTLRPAVEDYVAAGGIIAALGRAASPEALAAQSAWQLANHNHLQSLYACASARELQGRGFGADVALCLERDTSHKACSLTHGFYQGR